MNRFKTLSEWDSRIGPREGNLRGDRGETEKRETKSHLLTSCMCQALPKAYRQVKVNLLSRVRLFATPWTVAYQAPPSMGFSRQECWNGLPFPSPGDLPDPGIEPGSPALQADALPSETPGKPLQTGRCYWIHLKDEETGTQKMLRRLPENLL